MVPCTNLGLSAQFTLFFMLEVNVSIWVFLSICVFSYLAIHLGIRYSLSSICHLCLRLNEKHNALGRDNWYTGAKFIFQYPQRLYLPVDIG